MTPIRRTMARGASGGTLITVLLLHGCVGAIRGPDADAGDGGVLDDRASDGGMVDSGASDGGVADVAPSDSGPFDTGASDSGPFDTGASDGGMVDAGPSDGGIVDGGPSDTGFIDGGVADTGLVDAGGPRSYTTDFAGTENPVSENAAWTNGGAVGLSWQDIRKEGGIAFATGTSAGYDDCIAHLSGFPPNQYAAATVHVASGYSPPSSHEVELLLRFQITANNARGYEILSGWAGAYSQIVRWNGPLNDFTYLTTTGPGFGALVEGDVIRATSVGSMITAYKNGVEVMQATDPTWADGDPGMGFFVRPGLGAVPQSYCYSAYSAGSL